MELSTLIAGLGIHRVAGPERVRVCDVTDDSRTVVPGSLFIARRGARSDGRAFIDEAVRAGAVAVLFDDPGGPLDHPGIALLRADDVSLAMARLGERFYGDPSSRLALVGVTGTNGKTTISHLVHQLLNGLGVRCGLIGTVIIDDGVEVAPALMTTPPALEISRSLAMMVDAGCRAAVVEVSSHSLIQDRVSGLAFDVAVFSNLSGDHLDYHGSMEDYARAKAKLFSLLSERGVGVVNADDPAHEQMAEACRGRLVRCSTLAGNDRSDGVDAHAATRGMDLDGISLALRLPGRASVDARLALTGEHNASNLLLALVASLEARRAAGEADPVGDESIVSLVARAKAPPGRLEPCHGPDDDLRVFVDYAHTDDALEKALKAVRDAMDRADSRAPRPSLWVVFGCGGDKDRSKRSRMGEVAARLARHVVVTSDNPRTESPAAIIGEILAGVPSRRRHTVEVHADRRTAIQHAIAHANAGDVVVIAGKGHETHQVVSDGRGGTIAMPFDDRLEARAALAQRQGEPNHHPETEGAPA